MNYTECGTRSVTGEIKMLKSSFWKRRIGNEWKFKLMDGMCTGLVFLHWAPCLIAYYPRDFICHNEPWKQCSGEWWLLSFVHCGDRTIELCMFHQANSRGRYNRAAFRYWSLTRCITHAGYRVARAFVHPNFSYTQTHRHTHTQTRRWFPRESRLLVTAGSQRRRQHLKARRRARLYLLLSL